MKRNLLIVVFTCTVLSVFGQVESDKVSYAITLGTGIPMSQPSQVPFAVQITGRYHVTRRISAGLGTGISLYEKAFIPLFANAKFLITRPRKLTPYIECSGGYSLAPRKDASGGIYLNPNIGIHYSIGGEKKLLLSVGYELQRLERLKEYENEYFGAQFKEALSHHSPVIKAGVVF